MASKRYCIFLFRRKRKKFIRKAVRLSPPTPINAKMQIGSAVRHRSIVFVVKEKTVIFSIGIVIPATKITASNVFLSFSIPPNNEPSLRKFGGIKKMSRSSLFLAMILTLLIKNTFSSATTQHLQSAPSGMVGTLADTSPDISLQSPKPLPHCIQF